MIFGDFMMGARSRLLGPSIPFRFFGAAVFFQFAAWVLIVVYADEMPGFQGGPGEMLAALHLVTLGVAVMTAMGAAFQILPAVTKRPLRSVVACKATFWLFFPGVLALTHGMGHQQLWAMEIGGGLVACGILLFAGLVADNLRQVGDMKVVTDHLWVALTCLLLLAVFGLSLVADFDYGILPDHLGVALAHAVVAAYGFMGMLALGFSFILIPLFGLSAPADERNGRRAAWVITGGLSLTVVALLVGNSPLLFAGAALGVAGLGLHLRVMAKVMKSRMREALGDSFVLIRLGWVLLPVSVGFGLTAAAGVAVDRTGPLFGFILVFGWLLSFLMGVLQRIMPFLASMHTVRPGAKPILVSSLTPARPLRVHMIGHLGAVLLVAVGLACDSGLAVRLGAFSGLIGSLGFATFFANMIWKLWRHHTKGRKC
ncbi:hypothetical protein [Telmatospirillum sp.]|uniref:hypothetical protein n=1 Tax=Telmatospirillum sp. TaxID=2079197 RepID=UPI0028460E8A|nr:hypothetical protein [Telmatospirillum sp.]MDR3441280.1 hypothetical protein [Telmatospirillum sp.]